MVARSKTKNLSSLLAYSLNWVLNHYKQCFRAIGIDENWPNNTPHQSYLRNDKSHFHILLRNLFTFSASRGRCSEQKLDPCIRLLVGKRKLAGTGKKVETETINNAIHDIISPSKTWESGYIKRCFYAKILLYRLDDVAGGNFSQRTTQLLTEESLQEPAKAVFITLSFKFVAGENYFLITETVKIAIAKAHST